MTSFVPCPPPTEPIVDENGLLTPPWYQFISSQLRPLLSLDDFLNAVLLPTDTKLLLGTTSSLSGVGFQVAGTTGSTSSMGLFRFSNDANDPDYSSFKSRGTTVGTHVAVVANDELGNLGCNGSDGTAFVVAARVKALVDGAVSSGIVPGRLVFDTMNTAGTLATRMTISNDGGVQIGSPTGGSQGSGTLNVATNIYKNAGAYTNPDYVLEHWSTGKIEKFKGNEGAADYQGLTPLDELEEVLRTNLRLPGITDEPAGIFTMADIALEKIEEAHIYITQLHKRLAALEAKIESLGSGDS